MPKISANGIETHYMQRGQGEDVILLHGVTSSLAMWYNGVLPALSQSHHVTAYDLRGHGLTELTPEGYTSGALARDLHGLMDALDIRQAVLVGHSFGGAIGLHAAYLYPDRIRGVVMLDSGLACLRYLRIIHDWGGWKGRPQVFQERGLTLEQFLSLDSKQDVTEVIRHGLNMPRQAGFKKGQTAMTPRQQKLIEETKLGYEFRDVDGFTEECVAQIKTPVLAVYGENSPYKKMAERLAEIMENCRQDVLPGAGHFYAIHAPDLMLPSIQAFAADPLAYVSAQPVAAAVES